MAMNPGHSAGGACRFRYRAVDDRGSVHHGTLLANSERDVADHLRNEGLLALAIHEAPHWIPQRPVRRHDLAVVFRNVAILVSAGVPIERAIAASEPLVSRRLAAVLAEVRAEIRQGRSVAGALECAGGVFPRSTIGMIRAGELGSSLSDACTAAAAHMEEAAGLSDRLKAALAYPALICVVGFATVVVMTMVVIPRFTAILTDLGTELPPLTQGIMVASSALGRVGPALAVLVALSGAAMLRSLQVPSVRVRFDRLLLRLPLVGTIRLGFTSARSCRTVGSMLERGVPLLTALDAAVDAVGDLEISRRLAVARTAVSRGVPLSQALSVERAVNETALQLIGVGETSGRLGAMTSRAGSVAGEQAERGLRTAINVLEPLLVVIIGIIVACISAALLQAVYSIRPT